MLLFVDCLSSSSWYFIYKMFRLPVIVILSLTHHCYTQNIPVTSGTTPIDDVLNFLKTNTINTNEAQICEAPRRCIHHYQCREDGSFNIRGANIVNPRFSDENSNTLIDGKEQYQVSVNNTIIQKNGVEARVCNYLQLCCGAAPQRKIDIPSNTSTECGYRNPDGIFFKIDNTDKAQYGEFPWMVAVIWTHPIKNMPSLNGGGSLIHPNVILTAAHILSDKKPSEFKIRAGEWDTQTDSETLPHQERNVNQIIQHPEYDPEGILNDYALLVVDRPFILGVNIQTICLPMPNLVFEDETDCYSAGWGKDKFSHKERRQTIMKKVQLPIIPFEMCQDQLRKTQLGDIFQLHESFTCAGGMTGLDTCTGDGGSPLMCPVYKQNNRYYQTGIVSWGLGCGQDNIPGVYANVGLARDWIDDQMRNLGFGTDSYSIK